MLIALDSGLGQTMAIIGLKAFPAALVGGLDSLVGALARLARSSPARRLLLIHYVDPLLSEVVPFLVLIAMLMRAALGPVRHTRRARPCLGDRAPAAISAPTMVRTWPVATRLERVALASACSWSCSPCPLLASRLPARPGGPSVPRQRSARWRLMLLTGYAGQVSLGHAGLLAAGAFTVGILFKELQAPFWVTLPAAALVGRAAGRRLRAPIAARCAGFIWPSARWRCIFWSSIWAASTRQRAAISTGIVIEPPRSRRQGHRPTHAPGISFCWPPPPRTASPLRQPRCAPAPGARWAAIRANETVAEALGIGVASYKLLAFVISSALTAVAGALFAYYRGFVSVEAFSLFPVDPVRGHDHHRRHGLAGSAPSWAPSSSRSFPTSSRRACARLPAPSATPGMLFAVNCCGLRRRHDPVPGARAAGARSASGGACRPISCCWPFRHRPVGGAAPMTRHALLAVDKLEVVYQRAITALAGHLAQRCAAARSSASSAPTAPARPRCCAPSPASTASTMPRVTEGSDPLQGRSASSTRQPHVSTRAGIALVPEREQGVCKPDGGREPGWCR